MAEDPSDPSGPPSGVLRLSAYLSAALAAASAAISAYWAAGGRALLETVGGPLEELARRGGWAAVTLAATVAVLKLAGAALSLALVRLWGRRLPQRLLSGAAVTAGTALALYGGLLVAVGGLALAGAFRPPPADPTALRWHVLVWDLWFLLWGGLLLTAGVHHRRRNRVAPRPLAPGR